MKNEKSAMHNRTIEDIERAAWFARLALGDYERIKKIPLTRPAKTTSLFHVIP